MQINRKNTNEILTIVMILKKKYGTWNPFYIAKRIGIEYTFVTFNENLLAFSEKNNDSDFGRIYISQNLCSYAHMLLGAHELGHLLMHECGSNLFNEDIAPEQEFEANYFMSLLVPKFFNTSYKNFETVEHFNKWVNNMIEFIIKNGQKEYPEELKQTKSDIFLAKYPKGNKLIRFDYLSGNIVEIHPLL